MPLSRGRASRRCPARRSAGGRIRRSRRSAPAADLTATLRVAIGGAPASEYNLISDTAPVPITVTNGLDTRIRVRIQVSSDRPLVHIEEQPVVEVPARGQVETTVPVSA